MTRAVGLAAIALVLAACAAEERVVRYKPFFAGLEGAKMQRPPVLGEQARPLTVAEGDPSLRSFTENADGSITLVARTPRQLMNNIARCLEGDPEPEIDAVSPGAEQETLGGPPKRDWARVFADQVLSRETRDDFKQRGLDPAEAYAMLKAREMDIAHLFSRMPMAEHTPTVLMTKLDTHLFRIRVTGKPAEGLQWSGMDVVFEKGQWRLRWFVE